MNTKRFERLLQEYLKRVNTNAPAEVVEMAAYRALEEAAGLLGVSMLSKR